MAILVCSQLMSAEVRKRLSLGLVLLPTGWSLAITGTP